jgi:signal peptidase II
MYFILVVFVVSFFDQVSKYWAVGSLTRAFFDNAGVELPFSAKVQRFLWFQHPIPWRVHTVWENFWHFRYVENPGAAWGFLSQADASWRTPFFLGVSSFAMLFMLYYIWQWHQQRFDSQVFAFGLIMGGALGNFSDRARLGYVVDFIDWHYFDKATWPTFNVADSAITLGVVFLLLSSFQWEHQQAKTPG